MNVSADDVLKMIADVLRSTSSVNEDGALVFEVHGRALLPVTPDEISKVVDLINSFDEGDDGAVLTGKSYEVVVQTGRQGPDRLLRRDFSIDDSHSKLTYTFGRPSDAFAIYLCFKVFEMTNRRTALQILRPHIVGRMRITSAEDPYSVFDLVKIGLRARSLSVVSQTERPRAAWKQYVDALFFHVGYNLDLPLIPDRNLSELLTPAKISSLRRSDRTELDAPHRVYVPDLVYHYQLGVSAESPMLEYISYYHVAEHWFEEIYQDDLVEQIQLAITSPSFSYKRKKDLRDLIRKVSRAVQIRNEQLIINEQVALKLTLTKYVDVNQLASDLNDFDSSLVDWYANNVVSFCDGDRVPFGQPDASKIISALSNRIYKTRNALVHSKEGSKGKFVPFADDRDLIPEIPLMRFVAEQIIIATSSIPG